MVYVEQLLKSMYQMVVSGQITDQWRQSFITNVVQHIDRGSPLSTSQSRIVCKIASNYHRPLAAILRVQPSDIAHAVANPVYVKEPYQSADIRREVRYLGMNKLAFRFKLDQTVVQDIKSLRTGNAFHQSQPVFNDKYRLWIVMVDGDNLEKIFKLIKRHKFEFDESVLEYLTRCANTKQEKSAFVLDPESNEVYANICNNPLLAYVVEKLLKGKPL